MAETRLRFGSKYIETGNSEDFPLALTIGIADIADISKRKGVYSKNFKVPATQANNSALEHIWQDQIEDDNITGVVYGRNISELEHNGISWDRGYAKVAAVLKDSQPREYEITYFGGNSDWLSRVGDSKLNELDSSTTATYDKASILAAASGSLDWVYPLINYGGWASAQYALGTTGVPFGVSTWDFRPAFRISALVEKIFENVGYTVTSNWLDTPECTGVTYLAGEFARLETDRVQADMSGVSADFTYAGITGIGEYYTLDESTEYRDTQSNLGAVTTGVITPFGNTSYSGTYDLIPITVAYDGKYYFDASFELLGTTAVTNLGQCFWEFRDLGTDAQVASGEYDRDTTNAIAYALEEMIELEAGKTYVFNNLYTSQGTGQLLDTIGKHSFSFYQQASIKVGDTFLPFSTLGEEKQLDFLSKIAKTYNLYFDTDTHTRSVLIEPRNDWTDTDGNTQTGYYKGIDEAVDWSDKLDLSEGIQIKYLSDYKDELEFRFEDIGDWYPERYEEKFGFQPFRQLYTFPSEYNAGRTVIEQGYVPTINKYEDAKLNNGVTAYVQTPFIYDDEPGSQSRTQDVEPRLLVYEWTSEDDYLLRPRAWVYFDDTATADPTGVDPINSFELPANYDNFVFVPKAWVVNNDDTSKFQLSWASYGDGKGLADRFYNETVRDLRNRTYYEASFRLRPSDILPYLQADGFRKPVHVNGVYYRVNKIKDYKPQSEQSTKVELVKIVPRSAVDFGSQTMTEIINLE